MNEEVRDALPKKFRTSVGGFNKNDVNEYIMYMNSNFKSVEETLKNTINLQKQELDTKNSELHAAAARAEEAEACRASLAETEAALAERDAELTALNTAKSVLVSENESLRRELEDEKQNCLKREEESRRRMAELEKKCQDAAERMTQLERKLAAAEAEKAVLEAVPAPAVKEILPSDYEELREKAEQSVQLQEKADMYDRMSSKLGEMLIAANNGADAVIKEAQRRADEIVAAAEADACLIKQEKQTNANTMIVELQERLRQLSGDCCEDIALEIEEMRNILNRTLYDIKEKYSGIYHKIDFAKVEMEQMVEKELGKSAKGSKTAGPDGKSV